MFHFTYLNVQNKTVFIVKFIFFLGMMSLFSLKYLTFTASFHEWWQCLMNNEIRIYNNMSIILQMLLFARIWYPLKSWNIMVVFFKTLCLSTPLFLSLKIGVFGLVNFRLISDKIIKVTNQKIACILFFFQFNRSMHENFLYKLYKSLLNIIKLNILILRNQKVTYCKVSSVR